MIFIRQISTLLYAVRSAITATAELLVHILLSYHCSHGLIHLSLSPVHTVAEKCDCRRKRRLSQKTARKRWQSPNSATVALFCDSRRRLLWWRWRDKQILICIQVTVITWHLFAPDIVVYSRSFNSRLFSVPGTRSWAAEDLHITIQDKKLSYRLETGRQLGKGSLWRTDKHRRQTFVSGDNFGNSCFVTSAPSLAIFSQRLKTFSLSRPLSYPNPNCVICCLLYSSVDLAIMLVI